ncbi:hypothetical protein Csa_023845, partial [Cucumis sativus]
SGLALLLSTGECIVASIESREFPTQALKLKEPNAFSPDVGWLSYFLRAMFGSTTFYMRMYCGFGRELKVSHETLDTKETQHIFARSGLALLLSTGDGHRLLCGYGQESRVSHTIFNIEGIPTHSGPKWLDSPTFYGRLWLQARVESSPQWF